MMVSKKQAVYYRSADGKLAMQSSTNEQAMENIQRSVNRGDMSRVNAYQEAVSQPKKKDEMFRKLHSKTACIVCRDAGLITAPIERNGHDYTYGFACVCPSGERYGNVESITTLTSKGLYRLKCSFASEADQCPLPQKAQKCVGPDCPKFDEDKG